MTGTDVTGTDGHAEAALLLASLAYDADGTLRRGIVSTPYRPAGRSGYAPYFHALDDAFDPEEAAWRCLRRSDAGHSQYLAVQLLRHVPPPQYPGHRPRGGAADTAGLAALFADVDFESPGHSSKTDTGLPHPPDMNAAMSILAPFPPATFLVFTGGGLQPWWILDRHAQVDPGEAGRVVRGCGDTLRRRGRELGCHVDQVGDLARVGRLPGTVNHKYGTTVRIVDSGPRYNLESLAALIPAPPEPPPPRPPVPPQVARASGGVDAEEITDRWNAETDWSTLLEPAGWTLNRDNGHGERQWTRPGKSVRDGNSATSHDDPPTMTCYSSSTTFPVNQRMTKLDVYAHLAHGGDCKAAWRAIAPPLPVEPEIDRLTRFVATGGPPEKLGGRLHWAAGRVTGKDGLHALVRAVVATGGMTLDDAARAATGGLRAAERARRG